MNRNWKLIVFVKGKRREFLKIDPRVAAKQLRKLEGKKGVKAHVVSMNFPSALYPPEEDDLSSLAEGMLWCPYCRRWRWFQVPPKGVTSLDPDSPNYLMHTYYNQGIAICKWCHTSEEDLYVKRANGTWDRTKRRRRRGRKRRRRS